MDFRLQRLQRLLWVGRAVAADSPTAATLGVLNGAAVAGLALALQMISDPPAVAACMAEVVADVVLGLMVAGPLRVDRAADLPVPTRVRLLSVVSQPLSPAVTAMLRPMARLVRLLEQRIAQAAEAVAVGLTMQAPATLAALAVSLPAVAAAVVLPPLLQAVAWAAQEPTVRS